MSGRRGNLYPVYVTRLTDMRYIWDGALDAVHSAAAKTQAPPVIAGDEETTYYLVGLEPVVAMAGLRSHSTYSVEQVSGARRRADDALLLSPATPEKVKGEILARWHVSYVAFWLDREPQRRSYEGLRKETSLFGPFV